MKTLQYIILTSVCLVGFSITSISAAQSASRLIHRSVNISAQQDVQELINTAYDLYKQKKFDEALAIVNKAIAISPNNPRPPALAGFIYFAQLKLKSASDAFAKSISLDPNNKLVYLAKARVDQFRNARDEATAAARKALEIDSSYTEAYLMLGDILRFDKDHRDEAIAAYRSALKINPNLPMAYENLAQIFADDKNEKDAEETFRQAMAADPKHMVGRFALGRLLVKQRRLEEARKLWEERLSDEDKTFPNFITVLERAEKLEQTKAALAQKPNDPETLVQMGFAVMEGDSWVVDGRQERAIEYFKKALAINPDLAMAQYGISKAYIQINDVSKDKTAIVDEELAKLRKLDPKLADEMEIYRKNYSGGIKVASPSIVNQ